MNPKESAALSDDVCKDPLPPVSSDITVGGTKYEVLACRDSGSGYQGIVYLNINTKEVIVAHRGTEFDRQPMLDGGIDAAMVTARFNAQLTDALALTKQALRLAEEREPGQYTSPATPWAARSRRSLHTTTTSPATRSIPTVPPGWHIAS
jgi:hypothetical protein